MKRNFLNINNSPLRILGIILLTLTFQNICYSQDSKEYQVKGKKGVLKCVESKSKNRAIYSNVNNKKNLREYYKTDDPELELSFLGFYINTYDTFLEAFHKTFSDDRIEDLAKFKEKINIRFRLNQDGEHLAMSFTLNYGTSLTPDEILTLEENIKKMVSFTPLRKFEYKLLTAYVIRTDFDEIRRGDITRLKKMEANQRERAKLFVTE
ncbi:MAG: hypothetical protein AB7V16_12600 [Vulcanibacillus sp.]